MNTRRRLQVLYGDDYRLAFEPIEPIGLRVIILLPQRRRSAA
jgi:LytS/YehU family sensor histidine kinase